MGIAGVLYFAIVTIAMGGFAALATMALLVGLPYCVARRLLWRRGGRLRTWESFWLGALLGLFLGSYLIAFQITQSIALADKVWERAEEYKRSNGDYPQNEKALDLDRSLLLGSFGLFGKTRIRYINEPEVRSRGPIVVFASPLGGYQVRYPGLGWRWRDGY